MSAQIKLNSVIVVAAFAARRGSRRAGQAGNAQARQPRRRRGPKQHSQHALPRTDTLLFLQLMAMVTFGGLSGSV